jgi:hypothetical protein
MTQERLVDIEARCTRARIRAMGMAAENAQRLITGNSPAYTEQAFLDLIDEEGIGYNRIVEELYQ